MTLLHRLASIICGWFRRARAEQELDDEMRAFVELSAADKVRAGVPPAQARRQAFLELGGIEPAKERVRTYRHGARLDEIGRDIRYGFRVFAKNPGFTVIVVLTLSLGIGANVAIFSLIDALMLRWLPVSNPQDLVQVKLRYESGPSESFSYPIVRALADQHDIFSGVAGFSGMPLVVGPPGSLNRVPGAVVTGAFYETLGVNSVVGRLLAPADDEPGAPLAAVISFGYWEREFARNPSAVGRTILANGVPVTIVGVSPRGFSGANVGAIADITMPVAAIPRISPESAALLGPGNFWLRVLARPQTDMPVREAQARLATRWTHLSDSLIAPHWPASRRQALAAGVFELSPGGTGWTFLRELYRRPLSVLMAMVGLVLLIACANVASLLLARASARQHEIAIRLAIGAGRGRIVRQLLIESTLLSAIGAGCGILLAWFSGRFLVGMITTGPMQVVFDLTPNWHVLAFTTLVAIATGIAFGLAPAFHAGRAAPALTLKEDTRMSASRSKILPSLVSMQVALSLVLLVGAALLIRTLHNLQTMDPGFSREGILLVDFEGRRTAFPPGLLADLQRIPGVTSASISTHTPLSGSVWSEPAVPAGQPIPDRDTAFFVGVGPRFFATLQIQLLAGRDFADRDAADSPPVAIVNEAFARRYFANQSPIGQRISATVRGRREDLEIVGLVRNTSAAGLRRTPPRTVYVSYAQLTGDFPTTLEIRARGSIGAVSAAVRRALQQQMPATPIEVRPLSAQVEATMVQERLMAVLAGAFGLLALVLACIGLYGLLAYSVARRTREIGIRMALGAHRRLVIGQVLAGAARLVGTGIALGLPAAWASSRWTRSMLFGLTPSDPAAIGGSIAVLGIAAMVAAYLPARRASRIDPLAALRHE
jgi:predicted permease